MKKNNKKGFTLAELLVVIAIIAVLVAIAIPVFTAQVEKAREAADAANLRAAYAQAAVAALDEDAVAPGAVKITQQEAGWDTQGIMIGDYDITSNTSTLANVKSGDMVTVTLDAGGNVTFGVNGGTTTGGDTEPET